MSSHRLHNQSFVTYFCTITCYEWLPLIEQAQAYDAVYKWFNYLKKDGCQIVGYVIMPNHLHVLLYPTRPNKTLNQLVGEGKRFMAYEIVKGLTRNSKKSLLARLRDGVKSKEREKAKKHQVFRLSFDARVCLNEKMLLQKLTYIHHNPVRGKWALVDDYIKYIHSSAGYYEIGFVGLFEVTHYKELGSVIISESSSSDSEKEKEKG